MTQRFVCENHGFVSSEGCGDCLDDPLDLNNQQDAEYLEIRAVFDARRRHRFNVLFTSLVLLALFFSPLSFDGVFDDVPTSFKTMLLAAGIYFVFATLFYIVRFNGRARVDFAATQGRLKNSLRLALRVATSTPVIASLVVIWVFVTIPSAVGTLLFGYQKDLVYPGLQIWRLFTAGIVHKDAAHLASNLTSMLFLGVWLDLYVGRLRFVTGLIVAVLFGSLTHMFLDLRLHDFGVGLSGGVFGIFGMALVVMPRQRVFDPIFRLTLPVFFVAVLSAVPQLVTEFSASANATAHFAHLGGFMGGALFGLVCRREPTKFFRLAIGDQSALRTKRDRSLDPKRFFEEDRVHGDGDLSQPEMQQEPGDPSVAA